MPAEVVPDIPKPDGWTPPRMGLWPRDHPTLVPCTEFVLDGSLQCPAYLNHDGAGDLYCVDAHRHVPRARHDCHGVEEPYVTARGVVERHWVCSCGLVLAVVEP